jgi:hypothetical protein
MDYELTKELEDAGFPQGGKGSFVAPADKIVVRREHRVYCPTLSELIEACGNGFGKLQRSPGNGFDAYPADGVSGHTPVPKRGPTPEEAVARLWLALNR